MKKSKSTRPKANYLMQSSTKIEETYESFGIQVRVVEISLLGEEVEYRLKVSPGISLSKIKGKANDVAMALKSTTGKVKIEAPIPNTDLVGIAVPLPKTEQSKKKKSYEVIHLTKTVKVREYTLAEMLRDGTTWLFQTIGKYSYLLAEKTNQLGRKDE